VKPTSRLKQLVPTLSRFHTNLPLEEAWSRYDSKYCVSQRSHIPPSFHEVRHTLNLAQVMAIAENLEMICFDGDNTLYSDGGNFSHVPLAATICLLMENGVKVVLITAAGYGWDGAAYETRVRGLLDLFLSNGLSEEVMARFFVLGGECNYLLRCDASGRLVRVPDEEWQGPQCAGPKPREWSEHACRTLLDVAEKSFRASMEDLKLRARLIRKPRGIGIIPGGEAALVAKPVGHGSDKLKAEALDEVVLRVQHALRNACSSNSTSCKGAPSATSDTAVASTAAATSTAASTTAAASAAKKPPSAATAAEEAGPSCLELPWCAFNGGRDAWVDVGNKSVGVQAMQAFLGVSCSASLHVGDQFLHTGNDVAARECCPCIWIVSPKETLKVLEILLGLMGLNSLSDCPALPSQPAAATAAAAAAAAPGQAAAEEELPSPPPPGTPTRRNISGRAIKGYTYALPELAVPISTSSSRPGSPLKSPPSPMQVGKLPPYLSIGGGAPEIHDSGV